jgi:hypothetical protein
MARVTISDVLNRLEQNEQRNAALFAGIIDRLGELSVKSEPKAEMNVVTAPTEELEFSGPTEAELAQQNEKNTVNGRIKRLAFHKEGLLLEGNSKWFNAPKGSKLFEKLSTGTVVTLSIEGDWVKTYSLDGKAVEAQEPKATETKPATTEGGCEFCKGSAHRHVSTIAVQTECLNRQFNAGASFTPPETVSDLLDWVINTNPKFAGMGAADKAAFTSQTEAPKETEQKQDAPKEQRRFSGRRFSGRRSNGAPKEKELEATVTGGTYKGFINRIGLMPETAHMVRIVSDIHTGDKGQGVWFSATKELLAGRSIGDRVSFVLDGRDKNLGKLIGLTLLGSVESDTGHKEGVKPSGKQDAPAPKGQPKDEVVAAGPEGAAAKAAKVQQRRSRMAAANKSAA